jgi:ABC-type uncharacterized transport system auxiliary subunit
MHNRAAPKLLQRRLPWRRAVGASLLLVGVLVTTGLTGCADLLKQPALEKALFSVEPGLPDTAAVAASTFTAAAEPVLQVRPVRVSPPFDGVEFVYKTAPSQFTLDYYDNFVAPPSALLTGGLLGWLEKDQTFLTVGPGTSVHSDLALECDVTALLIDFSDRNNPRAVIAARFLLHSLRTGAAGVLLDSSYEVSKPVTLNSPAGYSSAWGMAFREILQKLEIDLRNSLSQSRHAAN